MKLVPATVTIEQGSVVYCKSKEYVIQHVLDLHTVLAKDLDAGKVERLEISDIAPYPPDFTKPKSKDQEQIPDKDWEIAQERFAIIRPLLNTPERTRKDVERRAAEYKKHVNTLYGWIRLYEECETLTVLMPQERKDKGRKKVSPEAEAVIEKVIEKYYLTKQQRSIVKIHRHIKKLCKRVGIKPPHIHTVRNRVNSLPEFLKIHRRRGRKEAVDKFGVSKEKFPSADYPYAVIQIDHTPLDIILVDDVHRLPIGRPTLTLAIDVFSRIIAGFYVGFEPPSAITVGLCLSQTILPKDMLLTCMDIGTPWPCRGLPRTVHADNTEEFSGKMLDHACIQYGIDIEWSPVERPNFGGHIERLLCTVSKDLKDLSRTTFSSIKQKGEYDYTNLSALTISELERLLMLYFCEVYHQRYHSGIYCSPMIKFEEGIFGSKTRPGSGLPARIVDEEKLKLDFLPFVERTVQEYGILTDHIYYYDDALRRWINATVPGKSKRKRKFIVRYDPKDLSCVWFYDPELEEYFQIPYRDSTHPVICRWELHVIKHKLIEEGRSEIDEDAIFDAYERMNDIKSKAEMLTKKERKRQQQKKKNSVSPSLSNAGKSIEEPFAEAENEEELAEEILPFDEMEEI